jgi:hypothetical protein
MANNEVGLGWTSRYPKSSKVNVDRVYFMPDVVRMTAVEGTHKFLDMNI